MKKPTGVRFKEISGRKLSQYLLLALLPLVVIGGYSAILILSLLILSFLIYSLMCTTVENGIERELKNSTAAILDTVRPTTSISIKNYLRAVAGKTLRLSKAFMHDSVEKNL